MMHDMEWDRTSRIYRQRWWTLGVLALSLLIVVIDNSILNVALPTIQRELDASVSELQWMVDAYILVLASLMFTMGSVGDKIGRARTLRIGLIIFAGASLWAMTANGPDTVIAGRSVMGIGSAMIMPATLAIIMYVFPPGERGKAIGIWAAMAGVGIALGPITGGLLLEHFSWGSVFFINVPIAAMALIAGIFLVPDSRNPNYGGMDIPGTVLSAGALALLVFGLIKGGEWDWLNGWVIACFVGAVILGFLFVSWERRSSKVILDISLFRNLRVSIGASGISMMMLLNFGMVFGLTLYMQFVHGYSALDTGIRFLPLATGVFIGSATTHQRVNIWGSKPVVGFSFIVMAVVLLWMAFWDVDTSYWVLSIAFFILGFAVGNAQAANVDSVISGVPVAQAGVGSAINSVSVQVGGAIGVAALGSVLSSEYTSSIQPALEKIPGLSPQIVSLAEDSVGSATIASGQLTPEVGEALRAAAHNSFMDGWQVMAFVACGIALLAAILIFSFLPSRPSQQSEVDPT